jgi:hypothetical protein
MKIFSKPPNDASRKGWDQTFRNNKQRYDEKRKGDPERRQKERARQHTRTLTKTHTCENCGKTLVRTVWHHLDYDFPKEVIELCYTCHRAVHPRPMPQDLCE